LEKDVRKKNYKLEKMDLLMLINALSIHECTNQEIWEILLMDVDALIKVSGMSNMDIYYLIRSMSAVNLISGDVINDLVNYLVKRGYDSDDFI
jgi:hypothetical protein